MDDSVLRKTFARYSCFSLWFIFQYLNLLKRKTERGPAPSPQTEPRLRCIAPPYPPTGLCGYGLPRTPVPMPPGTGNAPPSSPVTSCPSSSWGRPQNTNSTGWTKPPAHHINEKPRRAFSCRGFWRHASILKVFPCPFYGSPLDVGLKLHHAAQEEHDPVRTQGDQRPVSLRSRRPVSWPASWRRACHPPA